MVDSDFDHAKQLGKLLCKAGFPCSVAADSERATAVVEEGETWLALIHAKTRTLDGVRLCRDLLALRKPVRSILFAPSDNPAIRKAAFRAGAIGFHSGPRLDPELLRDAGLISGDLWESFLPRSGQVGRGREVLVTDDDHELACAAAQELAAAGFCSTVATSGKDGLLAAAGRGPEAVVLDVHLPDHCLEDMASALKAQPGGISLMFWTGAADSDRERYYLEALGADAFTVKVIHPIDALPFNIARMLERPATPPRDLIRGTLRLDRIGRRVFMGERPVAELTRKEALLLSAVAGAPPGRVDWRTLNALIEDRPQDGVPDSATNCLRVHLSALRGKLAGHGIELKTIDGFGLEFQSQ